MGRFHAIEAFVLLVDAGSVSGAARELGAGRPQASKLIASLADRLQLRLFVGSPASA